MKTLNTLIKELQAIVEEDETVGELPVYVYADHRQTYIQAGEPSIDSTLAYDYYAEGIHPDDITEARKEGEVLQFITIGD